jgi:hypothetical protein
MYSYDIFLGPRLRKFLLAQIIQQDSITPAIDIISPARCIEIITAMHDKAVRLRNK